MSRIYYFFTIIFLGFYISFFLISPFHSATNNNYPKKANYYLGWSISDAEVPKLAKWDLLILDMEIQVASRSQLEKIRKLNPDIIILAYVTSQEMRQDALVCSSALRRKLASGIYDNWYMANASGQKKTFWSGTYMLNPTDVSPLINGYRFNKYLAQFMVTQVLATGLWDGIFYDNAWDTLTWFTGSDVDLDRDGQNDIDIDTHWQNGLKFLFNETRRLAGSNYIIIGNGNGTKYASELNGMMIENFPTQIGGWTASMDAYRFFENGGYTPKIMVINVNTGNSSGQNNYQKMRYGLTSALMSNGYYSFDQGDASHWQLWQYDEYDVNLGVPLGNPVSTKNYANFKEDVWRRDYQNGLALVNATNQTQTVNLGTDYEKINGQQDSTVNDGSIISSVSVPSKDGLIMLKSLSTQTIDDLVYINGNFLRFYDMTGNMVRNGFFAYDDTLAGGVKLYNGNTDSNPKDKEKIINDGFRFEIYNSAGERWFNYFPFGGNFSGEINMAVKKLFGDAEKEILIAPSAGGNVIMYNYHGYTMQGGFYPYGFKDRSGFSLAIGNLDGGKESEAIMGVKRNGKTEVLIWDARLANLKKTLTLDSQANEIRVASGDVNGDGVDEVIVGLNYKSKAVVQVYTLSGRKLSEFTVPNTFGSIRIDVGALDVNYDGRDDIVVMTK